MIYKCKNCGGNSVYHPEKKTMWCPHCESQDSEERIENESMTSCTNCGAPLDGITEYTSAMKCSHCGSYLILKDRVEGEHRVELILPFAISRERAVQVLKQEFKNRIFTPSSFLDSSTPECLEGSYVPFWMYDYLAQVDYQGKATKVSVHRRGDTEITETYHYQVVRKLNIDFEKLPVDASKRMADDIMDLMEPYEYQALQDFQEKYMSGFDGEIVNFTDSEVEERAKKRANEDSETLLAGTMAGYTTNIPIHKSIHLEKKNARKALLPVWVYRYQFRGKDYLYYVNGQTGKVIGETPTDFAKAAGYSATVGVMILLFCQCINWILGVL